jgi:hypothetical protein
MECGFREGYLESITRKRQGYRTGGPASAVEASLTRMARRRLSGFADDAGRELSSSISNIASPHDTQLHTISSLLSHSQTPKSHNVTSQPALPADSHTPADGSRALTKGTAHTRPPAHILITMAPLAALLPRNPRIMDHPRESLLLGAAHRRRDRRQSRPRAPRSALRRPKRAHHHPTRNLQRSHRAIGLGSRESV